jgi:tRNA nucleotidyltransferase (CCA-adding enzyme)
MSLEDLLMTINTPSCLSLIQNKLNEINAKAVIVGGFVRDAIIGISQSKDIDIEVYGCLDIETIKVALSDLGSLHEVGKSFGVLKLDLDGYDIDVSLPRTESKTGSGHRGFSVDFTKVLDFKEAAFRRDFTVNSMGYDLTTKSLYDPYDGLHDIENRVIKVVDEISFQDDPLRVLRAVQFAARFGFDMEEKSLALCSQMMEQGCLDELPKERIFEELKKLLLRSKKPSKGFELLDAMGALFSEVKALQNVPQSAQYHPEGDVYIHTMMSLDKMAEFDIEDDRERLILMLAVLCHDFGKPISTHSVDGKIKAIGHEHTGLKPCETFLRYFTDEEALISDILPLVEHHLKPSIFYKDQSSDASIRRLSTKVSIERLIYVAKADFLGRTTKSAQSGIYEAGEWLSKKSEELKVLNSQPKALLLGRDLIKYGLTPSPAFKELLDDAYSAQLDGKFCDVEGANIWFDGYIQVKKKN